MRKFRGRGLLVTFSVIAVVVLLYAASGFFLAPRLIEQQLVALVEQRLGQTLTVERIKVNPFALSVDATGLRLAQGSKPPLVTARRVHLNLSLWGSGFGRGWVLSEAHSDGLQVMLETGANGHLNFAEVAQRWKQSAPPSKPDATTPRITVNHLVANDGVLSYREVSEDPAATKILPIRIELENLSTVPDREGHYSVIAKFVDGGALTWRGDLTLQPLQSEGDLELRGMQLATIWKFLRDDVRLAKPEGQLTIATHYKFDNAASKTKLALSGIRAEATDLSVARDDAAEPMLALKSLAVQDGTFELARRALVLPEVNLTNGNLLVVKHADGTLNWTGLARPGAAASESDTKAAVNASAAKPSSRKDSGTKAEQRNPGEPSPWTFELREINVDNVALRYTDKQRPLDLHAASLNGKAGLEVTIGASSVNVQTRDMDLGLQKVRLAADPPPVQLPQVQLQGGYFNLTKQQFGAKQLVVEGGTLRLERSANGSFALAETFKTEGNPSSAAQEPWTYAIDQVRVQNLDVDLSDLSFGKPIAVPMAEVSVRLENFASAATKPMTFKASANIGSGGFIEANGLLAQNFSRLDGKMKASGVALTPLQPLITRYAAVDLASGSASATATIAYRQSANPEFTAKGGFALANLRLNEAGTKTRVLAWKNMSAADARLTLGPDRVLIKEIVLDAPEMTIDISDKREINLAQLIKTQPASAEKPKSQAQAPSGNQKSTQFPIRIGAVRVRDGTVDYSDRSLVLPFATHVTNFEGAAAGFGTGEDRVATLQFDGDIGDFGSVAVNGRINAFSPKTLTDITASFQNVEMPELSPYTATFLGRKVDEGKLWVEVTYKVDNGTLTANNDITIRELKLGEKANAPSALDLPLDLAVALLTDSNGVIHTEVPIKGDLNDPKFDMGAVIRAALGNLIQRIVSAPFRALAGIFGGDKNNKEGSDVGNIAFEPGSAKVSASEKEKLQNVAKALEERPQLKLIVQAPYAPETDRAAMKRELARREVARALGRSLQPDEKAVPIEFENLATQRALEKLSESKTDASAVRDWAGRYASKNGEPKRAGMFLRNPGDPKFYEAMYDWLAGIESVSDGAMKDLAENRADNVMETLRAAGIDPARIEIEQPEVVKRRDKKGITAELSLAPTQGQRPAQASQGEAVAADDES